MPRREEPIGRSMSRSQEYRQFAARCLEIERQAHDTKTQAQMLKMAQICHRLADEIAAAQQERCKRHQTSLPAPTQRK